MLQVSAEAKYDDESLSVRNLEASYGLFSGRLSRYLLTSLSHHDLRGEQYFEVTTKVSLIVSFQSYATTTQTNASTVVIKQANADATSSND